MGNLELDLDPCLAVVNIKLISDYPVKYLLKG